MPVDPYSPCPGGTGKKIKFCCSDLIPELQKLDRMLEGQQVAACLNHLSVLERRYPDRACLLATKVSLLRVTERTEEADAAAAVFLAKHPTNPVALAESALSAALNGQTHKAVLRVQEAIAACGEELRPRVYDAIEIVGRALVFDGHVLAAQAMLSLQLRLDRDDSEALGLLLRVNTSPAVPMVMKDFGQWRDAPEDAAWKAGVEEARGLAVRTQWTAAANRLAALCEQAPDAPVLWRNLAVVRAWAADTPGCIEALRKYARLDVPLEDAVEAQALAFHLAEDPLGDQVPSFTLEYTVQDEGPLLERLRSAPRAVELRADPEALAEDEYGPPLGAFLLLDREAPASMAEVNLHTVPRIIGEAVVFGRWEREEPSEGEPQAAPSGRQQPAKLVINRVLVTEADRVKALLAEAADGQLASPPEERQAGRISPVALALTMHWHLPNDFTEAQVRQLSADFRREIVLRRWPQQPLGVLDGKSPQQAAGEESYRLRLLAAIMVLEAWNERAGAWFDFNELRAQLGLPTLGPIDPEESPLAGLPLVRWPRVMVEKLSDADLQAGFRRASSFNAPATAKRFAQAILDRPGVSDLALRQMALQTAAKLADDSDEALRYMNLGREEAQKAGVSCASWDLREMALRFERGEADQFARLFEHLQQRHLREGGVREALGNLLVRFGLVRPDGTVAIPAQAAPAPAIVVPGQEGAEPGKLWMPESQKPAGDKPKIWMPGDQ